MKKSIAVCTVALTVFLAPRAWSNEKGNGGDVVRCGPSEKSGPRSVQHWRVLDSVFFQKDRSFKFRRFRTPREAMAAIAGHLDATVPLLGLGINRFMTNYDENNLRNGVAWISGIPNDLFDENLYIKIPNCGEPKQAVVRVGDTPRRYYYDANFKEQLERDSDEFSWMLVHEWLRDYVYDAEIIRFINGYLHSEAFFGASESEVKTALEKMGLREKVGPLASEDVQARKDMEMILTYIEPLLAEAGARIEVISTDIAVLGPNDMRLKELYHLISPSIWQLNRYRAVVMSSSLSSRYEKAVKAWQRVPEHYSYYPTKTY